MLAGPQASIGIGVRRKDRHAVVHVFKKAADGVEQTFRRAVLSRVDIGPRLVDQRKMHVHSAPRLAAVGLGHEGGIEVVCPRHALDDPLEENREVGCLQRVGNMIEVDLVLARPILAQGRVCGNTLGACRTGNPVEDRLEVLQFRNRQNLSLARMPAAIAGIRRAHGIERRTYRIDQIELELRRHHRGQPQLREPLEDIGENLPRIAVEALAIRITHPEKNLGGWPVQPGHARKRAGNWKTKAVRVAGALGEPGRIHIPSPHIQCIDGSWHRHALGQNVQSPLARNPFAARHAIDVYDECLEDFDVQIAV